MSLVKIADLLGDAVQVKELFDKATQLSQMYDDFIEADAGDAHKRAPGIHASELPGCERKIVYTIMDEVKKPNLSKNWRQRFQIGKALHAMIQADFHALARSSMGRITFEDEVPIGPKFQEVAKKLNIYSSCDGVFTFRDDPLGPATLRIGLEIKTESPDQYAKLQAPKPEHVDQAHVYMKCLDLPLMYFMYVNKGNQNNTASVAPYLIRFDPERWAKLEEKCKRVLKLAEDQQLPDRQESILCEFCPFAHTCQPAFGKKQAGSASWKQPRR